MTKTPKQQYLQKEGLKISDFDKIDLYGATYTVKDSTARNNISTINQNITNINNDLKLTKAKVPVISYDETKMQIKVTKGI